VKDLDAQSAIGAGGWDSRFAVALAVMAHDDIAAALIDTNGDEADIDLDEYERDVDGNWHEIGSGSAGDRGASWSPRIAATWGRAAPGETIEIDYHGNRHSITASETGWWLFIAPATDDPDAVPRWLGQR
jgi:hypothetical protein